MEFLDWDPNSMSMYKQQGKTDAETASEIVKSGRRWVLLFRGDEQPASKLWMINDRFYDKNDLSNMLQIASVYIWRHGIKLDEKL